ncbi:hypothetical protein EAF04_007073 [Stromatinia cepivora]|nr:hypothetical protein EAF04_007073 [Stromatinia cepivora]
MKCGRRWGMRSGGGRIVEPVFRRVERVVGEDGEKAMERGRGICGGRAMKRFGYWDWAWRAQRMFADAAEIMGFSRISDTNVADAPIDGLAMLYSTISEDGKRNSTFHSFLPREVALEREKKLTICTNTTVHRIVFSDENGVPRADKVIFGSSHPKSSRIFEARVKKEVIICSGALGSPQVLMLSSVVLGPREHLEEHNIKVIHDLPGVGSNLTDHPSIPVAWEVPIEESITRVVVSPLKAVVELGKYLLFGTGIMSFPSQTLSFFIRSKSLNEDATGPLIKQFPSSDTPESAKTKIENIHFTNSEDLIPDIELMPLPTSAMDDMEERQSSFSKIGIFCILATICNPQSRGSVRLTSSSPHSFPAVDFGILSHPNDLIIARRAVHLALSFGKTMLSSGFPLLRPITFLSENQNLDIENGNQEQMDRFIRHRVRNTFHYASTCRMGSESDEEAPGVVDGELRVHGVRGVRIADTSVFPRIVSHHPMAPAVMVAERCADFIMDDAENKD